MTESTTLSGAPGGVHRDRYLTPCRKKFSDADTVRYPRGGSAGLRRLSPASLSALSGAAQFAGLPDAVTKPAQLLAAFKAAAPFLKISPRLVFALDWLFRFTRPQDWDGGSRPVVWPSARMQGEELMLSPSRVKALNRALIEAGLIVPADSPNGKRYGRRDAAGRITEAYGFDLSPLALRYAEFCALAQNGRAERAELARQRRRITIHRRALAQMAAVAADYGLDDAAFARGMAEAQHSLATLAAVHDVAERQDVLLSVDQTVSRLQALLQQALAQLPADVPDRKQPVQNRSTGTEAESVTCAPMGLVSEPHYNIYKPSEYPEKDTVTGSEQRRSGLPHSADPEKALPDINPAVRLGPGEVAQLAPRLKPYLSGDPEDPDWPSVVRAADWLGRDLGISRPLWAEACDLLSETGAAIALAVVAAKDPDYFTRTPGHYFRGMVRKAVSGDLHLDRSVWGLRESCGLRHKGHAETALRSAP